MVAPRDRDQPDRFFQELIDGKLGPKAFDGCKFFLYSGDLDEQWGPRMSEQVTFAKELIARDGGTVVEHVRDPRGGHMGFRRQPGVNDRAVRYFIELTK